MAATTSGALKAFIEAAGLSISAYRDAAPKGAVLPYVVIFEGIAIVPDGDDNPNDRDVAAGTDKQAVTETAQVTLWDRLKKVDDGSAAESYTLPDSLHRALDGASLAISGSGAPPGRVWGVYVVNRVRLPEPEKNLVQHVITLEVHRDA